MAIAVDATSSTGALSSVSGATWSHTVGAGLNMVLVACVNARDATAGDDTPVSSITFNGVGTGWSQAQSVTQDQSGDEMTASIWDKVNPGAATANIVVTLLGTCFFAAMGAVSLSGVNQSTPRDGADTSVTDSDGANIVTTPTTTMAGCYAVDSFYDSSAVANITMDGGQTEIFKTGTDGGSDSAGASYKSVPTAGAQTMTWTDSGTTASYAAVCQTYAPVSTPTGWLTPTQQPQRMRPEVISN